MATAKTTLVVTVEYRVELPDSKVANFMADLAKRHGPTLGSENYSIWEWNPAEKVISAEVV